MYTSTHNIRKYPSINPQQMIMALAKHPNSSSGWPRYADTASMHLKQLNEQVHEQHPNAN
jgi:hypothetical protein